jgi:hypothetical protein
LTVVLTSLLAMVGVLFLMVARIDKMATSATTEHRQLTFAVDSVIALIGEDLVADVPGVTADEEHYDYPDANDPWLASLEPYQSGSEYRWAQISNIGGQVTGDTDDVPVQIVGERQSIDDINNVGATADADGDGVTDAAWFVVPGVTSTKGKPIYAAVRVVDNVGMLNVNTGFRIDPDGPNQSGLDVGVSGDSQLHINVVSLAAAAGTAPTRSDALALLTDRATNAADASNLALYSTEVIWRYPEQGPTQVYTPFDLSDELELRYRYLLNHAGIDTRLENWGHFRRGMLRVPRDPTDPCEMQEWFVRAAVSNDPNGDYAYRHIATTYNMDRIIAPRLIPVPGRPQPRKMLNVNTAGSADMLRPAVRAALPAALSGQVADSMAAQIAVNLADYIDDDSVISYIDAGSGSGTVYGFERPCVYISELAYNHVVDSDGDHRSYGVELYKPYNQDPAPSSGWRLVVWKSTGARTEIPIAWPGGQRFHVLVNEDSAAPLDSAIAAQDSADIVFAGGDRNTGTAGDRILLQRPSPLAGEHLTVDAVIVPTGWMEDVDGRATSIERDITPHHCIVRAWPTRGETHPASLGRQNSYQDPLDPLRRTIQAHPKDSSLTNIGEIGMVLAKGVYCRNEQDPFDSALDLAGHAVGATASEILINLSNPVYADLFNYLTVIDPSEHVDAMAYRDANGVVDADAVAAETRIQGRININTAPAFVLAQLPWLQYSVDGPVDRASRIVAFRDEPPAGSNEPRGAYESIADLMQLHDMWGLAYDGENNLFQDPNWGPDLTPDDVSEDYEERDLLFTRISNLVTTRSDVFTAYILVRVGTDGPQQRVVAILDRSGVWSADERPRRVALYQVPDPR